MKGLILFVLCAVITSVAIGCDKDEEVDECSSRDNRYARCECQCLRWHGSPETHAYTDCMEICSPQPVHTLDIQENCIDKLSGWEREECADALNQCECVEQTLKHNQWAWLYDFIAKEKCLGTMLAADAEQRGCYLYDGEGGVQHFCECIKHLRRHQRTR